MTDRIVTLVDMDCFYCQVETKLNPTLKGKPMAVVQYNAWKGGGIIAVNYEARDRGVTRYMRGDEAKKHCPEIELVRVPMVRDKADLSRYRDASREVFAVLCRYSDCVQRASIDEAYIDLTDAVNKKLTDSSTVASSQLGNTFVVGYTSDKSNDESERSSGTNDWLEDVYRSGLSDEANTKLALGAVIVEEMRADVFAATGFRCSAGIAHNKTMAKLVCGLHKPNRQTVLPQSSVVTLFETLPIKKIRSLGGKFGDNIVEQLGCRVMADLSRFILTELQSKFDEKTGTWLHNIAQGLDFESVTARLISKSIGCCKKFPGKTALNNKTDIEHWVSKLSEELSERVLEDQTMNKRRAQLLTVSMTVGNQHQATSKSMPLAAYEREKIAAHSYAIIKKICADPKEEHWTPIYSLGLSAGKFIDTSSSNLISNFLKPGKDLYSSKDTKVPSLAESNNSCDKNTPRKEDCDNNQNVMPDESQFDRSNSFFDKYFNKNKIKEFTREAAENVKYTKELGELQKDVANSEDIPHENEGSSKTSKNKILPYLNNSNQSHNKPLVQVNSKSKKPSFIENFLNNVSLTKDLVDPIEVFPDLSLIDDEMLSSFPITFKKKVMELRRQQEAKKQEIEKEGVKQDIGNTIACIEEENEKVPASEKRVETKEPVEERLSDCDIFEERDEIGTSRYFRGMKTCAECGEEVEKVSYLEHLDHHMAQRLHKEMNSLPVSRNTLSSKESTSSLPTHHKHKRKNSRKCINDSKKLKTLKTFFKG